MTGAPLVQQVIVRKNRYFDSVFLMQVANRMAAQPGIRAVSALLATVANRAVLAGLGYGAGDPEFRAAGGNDLIIAITGEAGAVAAIVADPDTWLARRPAAAGTSAREPRSIAEAAAAHPQCSVAVISVPGEHAAREARAALEQGLNVFLFSSNVALADELELKRAARDRGLIVMGPDCGTAYLGGAAIGFANAVRPGPIGIVAAAGTGLQEFASLVHQAGSGISAGIGTGGRDLADAIGGLSTLAGIDALEADPATQVIAILAKPPGSAATAVLLQRLGACRKPVILCLLGADPDSWELPGAPARIAPAGTLDEAARLALAAVGRPSPGWLLADPAAAAAAVAAQIAGMRPEQRYIRGLFAGGTLCYQAQAIFRAAGLVVQANAPIHGMGELADPRQSVGHCFVDLGAELFVDGRPHPMIDASLRRQRLLQEAEDPAVAVILLDFILGAIASRDPVGDLLGAIRAVQAAARARNGRICVVASVCGTDQDAQGLQGQIDALVREGVQVFPSSAQAAGFCRELLYGLCSRQEVR